MNDLQDRGRGSLVGGAVGDALGYEVEFMSLEEIHNRFGKNGITDYVLDRNGVAEFSDDKAADYLKRAAKLLQQ